MAETEFKLLIKYYAQMLVSVQRSYLIFDMIRYTKSEGIMMKYPIVLLFSTFLTFGCQSSVNEANNDKEPPMLLDDIVLGQRILLNGEIAAIEYYDAGYCMNNGIHLRLKTASTELAVHLGPVWYINQQAQLLRIGDSAAVNGLQTTLNGQPVVIAIDITTSRGTLKLRDERGVPFWRGKRRPMNQLGPVCPK